MPEATITGALVRFLALRAGRGHDTISSHQLENEGRRFIEREIGSTVNPSTISRKWRLLKIEQGSDAEKGPFQIDEDYVIVKTLPVKSVKSEKEWRIISICGESLEHIHRHWQAQLELFREGEGS